MRVSKWKKPYTRVKNTKKTLTSKRKMKLGSERKWIGETGGLRLLIKVDRIGSDDGGGHLVWPPQWRGRCQRREPPAGNSQHFGLSFSGRERILLISPYVRGRIVALPKSEDPKLPKKWTAMWRVSPPSLSNKMGRIVLVTGHTILKMGRFYFYYFFEIFNKDISHHNISHFEEG